MQRVGHDQEVKWPVGGEVEVLAGQCLGQRQPGGHVGHGVHVARAHDVRVLRAHHDDRVHLLPET